jgi:O-antigen/teichoic acid export membrane protein
VSLQAQLRLGWVSAIELLRQMLTVIAVIALVEAGAGLLAFLAITIPVGVVALLVTAAVAREDGLRPAFDVQSWRPLVRDTLPFAVATAIGVMYFRVAIVLLSLVSTDRETGYFGAAFRVLEVLVVIPQLVVGAAFPIFSHAAASDRTRLGYALQRVFDVCVALGVLLALLLFVGAPIAIDVIASRPEFEPSVKMLQIQAPALAFSFAAAALNYALLSLRAHREVLVAVTVAFLASAGLAAVLAAGSGGDGAAVAVSVGELALAAAAYIALRVRHRHVTPRLSLVARVALAAGVALGLVVLTDLPPVAGVLAVSVVYVGLLFALRAVPEELLAELRRLRS